MQVRTSPFILNLGSGGRLHDPDPLPSRTELRYVPDSKLGGPSSHIGCRDEDKNDFTLPGIELGIPASSSPKPINHPNSKEIQGNSCTKPEPCLVLQAILGRTL
jgi:hypothetical protein